MAALVDNQFVEVVEVSWTIPNFLAESTKKFSDGRIIFSQSFFIGGRVGSPDPQILSTLPIKVDTNLMQHWESPGTMLSNPICHLNFRTFFDRSKLPSGFALKGKLVDLKTSSGEDALQDVKYPYKAQVNFNETNCDGSKLFKWSEARNHVNKEDGSLKIYFKLEITFVIPKPTTDKAVIGDGWQLMNDFESLLKNTRNADVEITVSSQLETKSFHCHKMILSARSEVFRAMFESNMKEANGNVVEVDDILPAAMEHFISFLYCERFQDSSWIQSLPQLTHAAEKYCVKSLKKICDSHLILCVTTRNAAELGILAKRHKLASALKDVGKFIAENAEEISSDADLDPNGSDPNFKLSYAIP